MTTDHEQTQGEHGKSVQHQPSNPYSERIFESCPLPEPLDDLRFERESGNEIETMTLRAGDMCLRERYTYTDCFVTIYAPPNSPFGAGRPLRSLDPGKLEQKRREHFEAAFKTLREAVA